MFDALVVFTEGHHSKCGVIFGLNDILGCLCKIFLESVTFILGKIGKASLSFVFLGSADELKGDLFIGTDHTTQGESSEYALCHFFTNLGR